MDRNEAYLIIKEEVKKREEAAWNQFKELAERKSVTGESYTEGKWTAYHHILKMIELMEEEGK